MISKSPLTATLFIIICCLAVCGCKQNQQSMPNDNGNTPAVKVDSLTQEFLNGWNSKDSLAIMSTFEANAIVMNDSLIHKGVEEIGKNWVSGGVKVLSNIQVSSLVQEANESLAYSGGTYSLDILPPGGPLLKEKGNYSLVWSRQSSGSWKLTLVHIEDITRMPDIQ
jgi:ketosteroid isomerase-like protein